MPLSPHTPHHGHGEFDIRHTTRDPLPRKSRILFSAIKERILGDRYSLSLVLIGDTLAKKLNQQHRKRSYIPNVLSFPLSETDGEIFINVRQVEREAADFIATRLEKVLEKNVTSEKLSDRRRFEIYTTYLFIHGCLHLKGYDHGDAMDRLEKRYLSEFGF